MKVRELFPELYRVVKEKHERVGLTGDGHNFWHAVRVAQCALDIAETPEVGRLAAAAGLCYNAGRILNKEFVVGDFPTPRDSIISKRVENCLRQESRLAGQEYSVIVEAVLLHNRQNWEQAGKPVAITLADADRIVNLEADVVIRNGQFHHSLPAVDPVHFLSDPAASYRDPRSVLFDISLSLDWMEPGGPVCIRLPKAWGRAKPRAEFLRLYLDTVLRQWEQAGMVP